MISDSENIKSLFSTYRIKEALVSTESDKSLFSVYRLFESLVSAQVMPGSLYSVAQTPMISDAGSAYPLAYLFDDMSGILFDGGSMVTYA